MRLKTIVVSIVVLAGLSVVAFFFTRPAAPQATDARLNQPLVASSVIEKATKLRLAEAGKSVRRQGAAPRDLEPRAHRSSRVQGH
jgi:hypothetical protein